MNAIESSASEMIDKLSQSARDCYSSCEEHVRTQPMPAVLGAVAIGYVLRFIPIFAIFGILLKLVLFLVKPAILIFGAAKLREMMQQQNGSNPQGSSPEPLVDSPQGPAVA
ncbi:MAG: hypothetical protein SFU53_13605 [Terrimicrobiaceae bacterium]|nr:hypothetical protein [Terrimicrobiaceae bacterium]